MKRGFTLIEALVALVIIGMLVTVLVRWVGSWDTPETAIIPDKCLAAAQSDYPGYENYVCEQGEISLMPSKTPNVFAQIDARVNGDIGSR